VLQKQVHIFFALFFRGQPIMIYININLLALFTVSCKAQAFRLIILLRVLA
jgi:hypothetical protein